MGEILIIHSHDLEATTHQMEDLRSHRFAFGFPTDYHNDDIIISHSVEMLDMFRGGKKEGKNSRAP